MRSRHIAPGLTVLALGAVLLAPFAGQAAAPPSYVALQPGGITELAETVPLTVVYVGIDPDLDEVRAELPTASAPRVRAASFYYGIEVDLGIRWTYDVTHVVADPAWTQQVYDRMDQLAGDHEAHESLTVYQQQYAAQPAATRTLVDAENQWIDAPSMEKWLADHPPAGVDTTLPTIYLLDRSPEDGWYPHVYTKTNEPDPDTGFNYGQVRHARKVTAWGGTAFNDDEDGDGTINRVWFYDLSAGPELFAGTFDVTHADVDGDGRRDYRIPPGWHYGPEGYVHPGYPGTVSLSTDLGKVIRFVGLDLLFTSSPLYLPWFTPDRMPETVNLDVNTIEAWAGMDASETLFDAGLLGAEHQDLPTGYDVTVDSTDVRFAGDVKQCYLQWVRNVPCYLDRHPQYPGFANLFLNWAHRTHLFQDGDADYEAAVVNYAIGSLGQVNDLLLGYADDNWLNATPSISATFTDPEVVRFGLGMTSTVIHEVGHHTSMSHPHDGYDPESGVDFGPTGDHFYAWLGDYSSSVMSYIRLNWDFSQFDHDNSARHHAAGYALAANRVAAAVEAAPGSAGALAEADAALVATQEAFADHEYVAALGHAEHAYRTLLAWADGHGVPVVLLEPSAWTLLPESKLGHLIGKTHRPIAGRIDLDPVQTDKWIRH